MEEMDCVVFKSRENEIKVRRIAKTIEASIDRKQPNLQFYNLIFGIYLPYLIINGKPYCVL